MVLLGANAADWKPLAVLQLRDLNSNQIRDIRTFVLKVMTKPTLVCLIF